MSLVCSQCGKRIPGGPRNDGSLIHCPACDLYVAAKRRRPWIRWAIVATAGGCMLLLGVGLTFYLYGRATEYEESAGTVDYRSDDPNVFGDRPKSPEADLGPPLEITARPVSDEGALKYGFKPGQTFRYTIDYEIQRDGIPQRFEGATTYYVRQATLDLFEKVAEHKTTARARGFVFHRDGYVLTNAGIVLGATHFEIEYDGSNYRAEVISVDRARDVAVLRINRRGLDVLRLSDIGDVNLPLTAQLQKRGSSELLDGRLAENANQQQHTLKMVDDRLTADGGSAVFDQRGAVIGMVATASGIQSKQGLLVVPIEEIHNLLADLGFGENKLSVTAPVDRQALRRSRAFVDVYASVDQANLVTIACEGRLPVSNQAGVSLVYKDFNNWDTDPRGTLVIDRYGRQLSCRPQSTVPFYFGHPELIAIEPLDSLGRKEWSTWFSEYYEGDVKIDRIDTESNTETTEYLQENIVWNMIRENDEQAVIHKKRVVAPEDPGFDRPFHCKLVDTSTIEFDKTRGIIRSVEYEGTVDYRFNERDEQVKMRLTCALDDRSRVDGSTD